MADAVTSQTLLDGERLVVQLFTNISDGTGESGVVKVDVSALSPNASGNACNGVKLNRVWGSCHGMNIRMLWGASSSVFFYMIPQNQFYLMDFSSIGGLQNNAGAGKTGDILFTTHDQSSGDSYTIALECIKTYAAS
jgi:hypothetical protein